MPEISRFWGIVIMMFADEHNPPHFHVRYGRCNAVFNLKGDILLVRGTLPANVLRKVSIWLEMHREELMDNWEKMRAGEEPKKIEPL